MILPAADLECAAQAAEPRPGSASRRSPPSISRRASAPRSASPSGSPAMTAEQLLAACDEALLRSKRAGKGRVELAA